MNDTDLQGVDTTTYLGVMIDTNLNCFSFPEHNYNTRSSNNLSLLRKQPSLGQFSIDYQGTKLWNKLPLHLKKIRNRASFKKALKKCLITQHMISDD